MKNQTYLSIDKLAYSSGDTCVTITSPSGNRTTTLQVPPGEKYFALIKYRQLNIDKTIKKNNC